MNIFLTEYSGFQKMIICFETIICILKIFWIFVKWIIFSKNILVLILSRLKRLLPNVSNSSEIIQGSLVGPISVHFRYLCRGIRGAPRPCFGLILEYWIFFLFFCEWIILLNILASIEWIFFWINIQDFVLNWILNWAILKGLY